MLSSLFVFLSADMADIFSNIYFAYSIAWEYENNKTSKILTEYCIQRLINENHKNWKINIEAKAGIERGIIIRKKIS